MNKWNVGDWCFFEFELSQIKEMEDGIVTCVTDGNFEKSTGSGFNDRCFPLDMQIKRISDTFQYSYRQILGLPGNTNIPDLHEVLINKWVCCCQVKDNIKRVKEGINNMNQFVRDVSDGVSRLRQEEVHGVRLMR